ncbi:MFS transporter [Brachybacterium hainanense]|uniref:MFS transporter n=1 Tax=Brachybacterium hainanense TaxID=1541174 RepID=A0ABV6RGH9_9MICO
MSTLVGSDRGTGTPRAFLAASACLVVAFAASSSPIPLYNGYRSQEGLTNADLAVAVVTYFAGTILALLVLGRLSTHVGRRPMALASLLLLLAGAIVLCFVDSAPPLAVGRFLMGLGCGIASSAVMAFVVDAAPARPPWLATVVTSQAPMLGLTLGALGSGAIVEHGPAPTITVYAVAIAALAVCVLLVLRAPETTPRTTGALASLRPRASVPARARPLLPVAALIFLATWSMGAFYQAFVPAIVDGQLGTSNALVVGLVFSSYMLPSVLGAPLGGLLRPAAAQRLGMTVFALAVGGVVLALLSGTLGGFLVASAVAGAAQGMAVSAAIRGIMAGASAAERAPTMAAIYLLCYIGAMLPSLVSGQLSRGLELPVIALGYGVLAALAALVTLLLAREPSPAGAPVTAVRGPRGS